MPPYEVHNLENGMFFAKPDEDGGNWISIGIVNDSDFTFTYDRDDVQLPLNLETLFEDSEFAGVIEYKRISGKRFKKLLMSQGCSRNLANALKVMMNVIGIPYSQAWITYILIGQDAFINWILSYS